MHLHSSIVVAQNIEEVTNFFFDPTSLAKWDRSVAAMIPTSGDSKSAGATFDTIAPSGMKMSYEVIEMNAPHSVKILLTNSKMFQKAIWHFEFEPENTGTKIICHVYFTLKFLYAFLYPVLYFNQRALMRDLNFFKVALEENHMQ